MDRRLPCRDAVHSPHVPTQHVGATMSSKRRPLGYDRYAVVGRNSGNSHNGKRPCQVRSSGGDLIIQVPRDRNNSFQSPLLEPHQSSTNELEEKIIRLYAKDISTLDIQETLRDL